MRSYLRFQSLAKRFGRVEALDRVSFEVGAGQVVALLGPNGAGKSTLFGCLLGLLRPDGGEILLNGSAVGCLDRRRFGYCPERLTLYPQRSVQDNGLFFARLKGRSAAELGQQFRRMGLDTVANRPVRQLSKGWLQRLGLAIALCGRPELLVLDEPFNGLDPTLLDELQQILREEQQRGATLLISTHTMSAIEPLATHAAILLEGRLIAFGALDDLRAQYAEVSLESIYHTLARTHRARLAEEVCA